MGEKTTMLWRDGEMMTASYGESRLVMEGVMNVDCYGR